MAMRHDPTGTAVRGAEAACPPGPRGRPVVGCVPDLQADWLGYVAECERRYGRLVHLRRPWPLKPIVLVTDPEHVKRVLLDDAASFHRPVIRVTVPVFGEGLVLAEDETWRRLHRMSVPAFQPAKTRMYAADMAACAEEMVAGWEHEAERDIHRDTTRLAVRIVARTLFGADEAGADAERASHAFAAALAAFHPYFSSRIPAPPSLLALRLFIPASLRVYRATRELDAAVYRLIRQRRHSGGQRADVLSMLLDVRDAEGTALTERELRDVAVNVFMAGYDTTASALAWTFYLLARHPEAAGRIRAEVSRVVGTRQPGADHVPLLTFTNNVVKESMRLFPPAWLLGRKALRDMEFDGYRVRRDTFLFMLPYLTHRNREYFPDPERFAPDRWDDEQARHLPRFAYVPFGGGPHVCIGKHLAMMNSVIVLATVVRAVDFELASQVPEPPRPSFTLLPARPVRLRVLRRASQEGG